ncbi:MAG TPA: YraN family protein [Opitutales bacterium]|nr:YraN family protein [Opitutales bacterium]
MQAPRSLSRLLGFFRRAAPTPSELGSHWEKVAAKALRKEGLSIVARNWRHKGGRGEIDIVAKDGESLVFIEVRSRSMTALVGGYHSITRHKKAVLRDTCNAYMNLMRKKPPFHRFDVVEISYRSSSDFELRHFRNVPLFSR